MEHKVRCLSERQTNRGDCSTPIGSWWGESRCRFWRHHRFPGDTLRACLVDYQNFVKTVTIGSQLKSICFFLASKGMMDVQLARSLQRKQPEIQISIKFGRVLRFFKRSNLVCWLEAERACPKRHSRCSRCGVATLIQNLKVPRLL